MPVHPTEETTSQPAGSITEAIAKNPSSNTASTASDAPLHTTDDDDDQNASSSSGGDGGQQARIRATAQDHQGNPGPVVLGGVQAEEIGRPADKEESRKRAEELNRD
ncbi:MAG: hypothetical protein M1816_003652 [Peltula sp. TS41687]|nr:MAG: hypothetical protein M1816_003652 [Peltula sp. TS41687]